MTDYPYDPELPFVVAQTQTLDETDSPVGSINARFRHERNAEQYVREFDFGFVELIDTTPKPKIPDDAEFIYWYDQDDQPYYARRWSNPANKVWETDEGVRVTEDQLTGSGWIGDAEVVVLKRA